MTRCLPTNHNQPRGHPASPAIQKGRPTANLQASRQWSFHCWRTAGLLLGSFRIAFSCMLAVHVTARTPLWALMTLAFCRPASFGPSIGPSVCACALPVQRHAAVAGSLAR